MKNTIVKTFLSLIFITLAVAFAGLAAQPSQAFAKDQSAAKTSTCGDTTDVICNSTDTTNPNCTNSSQAGIQKCFKNNAIVKDLNDIVDVLSAGVGVVVIGTIITGAIQYIMAGDKSESVAKARQRITNGVLALVLYLVIFAFLQWIVPGGVFNS